MRHHVIVDGSNLATEGRTMPSLQQLNDAIAAYQGDHPDALVTVVVDATFGHRIDPKEVAAFERAIETNAFVAPPAGAVGRGDGFVLSIAQKANASILSNDSYQEFHGEYAWLFDDGRLIGGKPVPHVGWVFVNRVPVRGPVSRRSVKEQKVVDKNPTRSRGQKRGADKATPTTAAIEVSANQPMPIPRSAPPGAVMAAPKPQPAAKVANDLLTFLSFVEHHPVGTAVTAVVEIYSSHGAYVAIGDAKGYVPLRLMADPAPRSAREVMAIGESVTLVVASFGPQKRSIDLAVPGMVPAAVPAVPAAKRGSKKAAAAAAAAAAAVADVVVEAVVSAAAEAATDAGAAAQGKTTGRRTRKQPAATIATPAEPVAAPAAPNSGESTARGTKSSGGRGRAKQNTPRASVAPVQAAPIEAAPIVAEAGQTPTKRGRGRGGATSKPAAAVVATAPAAATKPPTKRASGRTAPAPSTPQNVPVIANELPAADAAPPTAKPAPAKRSRSRYSGGT